MRLRLACLLLLLLVALCPAAASADGPSCFGAAARDPQRGPCSDPRLRLAVEPKPAVAAELPNTPCEHVGFRPAVCAFGAPPAEAVATVALVGDSHAGHWRGALDTVARERGWRGLSITHTSCPLQKVVRDLPEPRRTWCAQWKADVFAWFRAHPEVSTVFVAGLTGGRGVVARRGQSPFQAAVDGYVGAWADLPPTVRRIVVIRDTPKMRGRGRTLACVERAVARGASPGPACAVPRRVALDPDPAVAAARIVGSPRVRTIDMTRYFCGPRACEPVIGGALVARDASHVTAVFSTSLGPFLLRAVDRVLLD
jgi:hypothetical protein